MPADASQGTGRQEGETHYAQISLKGLAGRFGRVLGVPREATLPLAVVAFATVPVPTERRRFLLAVIEKGERHLRGPRIFCLEGGEHWHRHNMRKGLARACKRAKLRAIGWHVLRHTFCSHLAMRGAVPKAIQELAGHTTLAVTLRYMHLAPSALRDAIQLLDRPAWQTRAKTGEQAEAISAEMGAK